MASPQRAVAGEPETQRIPFRKIAIATVVGAIAAAVATSIVYFIADAADAIDDSIKVDSPGGGESSIGLSAVITATIWPLIIAGLLLAVLVRFTRRPLQVFLIVCGVVLVLSFFEPFLLLDDAPGDMITALLIMHVVAAVVGIGVILRLVRS
jgi:hypothetical protein